MKKLFSSIIAVLIAVSSCKNHEEAKPQIDQVRDTTEAEYSTDDEQEDENARISASATTTILYYQKVTNDQEFGQAINFRYWASAQEPDLATVTSAPETGTVQKNDLKLTGSARLPHNLWYVFEEPNDGFLFKFQHKAGVKGLLHVQTENTLYPFPEGYYAENGKLKVSGLWGTDQSKYEWDLYWFKADDGRDFKDRYQGDATLQADGHMHLYNRDGSGAKKDMYFRLPNGKYQFFVVSEDGRYSVRTATIGNYIPYLKFGFYE